MSLFNNKNAYWILFLALLGGSLGYTMGLSDRHDALQKQEQLQIESKKIN